MSCTHKSIETQINKYTSVYIYLHTYVISFKPNMQEITSAGIGITFQHLGPKHVGDAILWKSHSNLRKKHHRYISTNWNICKARCLVYTKRSEPCAFGMPRLWMPPGPWKFAGWKLRCVEGSTFTSLLGCSRKGNEKKGWGGCCWVTYLQEQGSRQIKVSTVAWLHDSWSLVDRLGGFCRYPIGSMERTVYLATVTLKSTIHEVNKPVPWILWVWLWTLSVLAYSHS